MLKEYFITRWLGDVMNGVSSKCFYVSMVIVGLISMTIGGGVTYVFDSLTIDRLEEYSEFLENIVYCTDNSKDSDGDGFSDFHEVFTSFTNPFNESDYPEYDVLVYVLDEPVETYKLKNDSYVPSGNFIDCIMLTPMQLWGLEHNISNWGDYKNYNENPAKR